MTIQNGLLPVLRKLLAKSAQVICARGALDWVRMADPINLRAAAPEPEPEPDIAAEIAARDEEILRLRDLLIARDQELGQVRGQLKVIEDHSERMARLAARIPLPGVGWAIDALLKLLSARRG